MNSSDNNGTFSKNLRSLELQAQTLFDGVGGAQTMHLLDTLSTLSGTEQKIALGIFQRLTERLLAGDIRIESPEDKSLNEFEDSLFADIESSIELETSRIAKSLRFLVLQGGRKNSRVLRSDENTVHVNFEPRKRKFTSY